MGGMGARKILLLCALGAAFGAYWIGNPSSDYRFRLEVEIATPDGLRTGSSVIEVELQEVSWGTMESRGIRRKVRGEAVFVDLGRGRHVIALLTTGEQGVESGDFDRIAERALESSGRDIPIGDMSSATGSLRLTPELLPTFVHFSNVRDPFSGRVIEPSEFETTFGKGVQLEKVTITFTNEPASDSISRQLPFLKTHADKLTRLLTTYPPKFQPQPYYFVRD